MVTPMNCSCCWDSGVQLYSCTEGHFSCSECLQTGIQILVNENRNVACVSDSCTGHYSDKVLQSVISDKQLIEKYNINTFVTMLNKVKIDNLYECPFCPNRVVIDDDIIEMSTFFCMNGCKSYSCMRCKRTAHEGPCEIEERHQKEERATQEFLITCCGVPFFRGDACNKVSCPQCKKYYCWICKQQIYSYDHFRNSNCELYGERPPEQDQPQQIQHAQQPQIQHAQQPQQVQHVQQPPHQRILRPVYGFMHQMQPEQRILRPTIGLMRPVQNERRRVSVRCSGITSRRYQCSRMTRSASGLCQDHY